MEMKWNLFKENQPVTYETGEWEGRRSDLVICLMEDGDYQLCKAYEYDDDNLLFWADMHDFEIVDQIIMWAYIPHPTEPHPQKEALSAEDMAEQYALSKFGNKIKTYSEGSSITAVYENCKQDFIAGLNASQFTAKESVTLRFSDLVFEDQLPKMTDQEYSKWYKKSCVVDGVRMGPKFPEEPSKEIEWISVKDRLPKERMLHVLVFNGDAPEYNQCVTQAVWFMQTESFKIDVKLLGTVTHWMPLPSPPKNSNPI